MFIDRISDPQAAPEFFFADDAELLQIVFANVQEADCILIRSGEDTVMIDCGSRGHAYRVVNMLETLGIKDIKLILNTHPHNDHLLGLEQIAQAVSVKEISFCFPEKETTHMAEALKVATKYDIAVSEYADGDRFAIGKGFLDVWLKGDSDWSLNERSAQMRLQFGDRTALFTADALERTQQRLLEVIGPELLDCDILKLPHHGLDRMNDAFLETVSPLYCVATHSNKDKILKVHGQLMEGGYTYGMTAHGYLSFTTDGHIWLAEKIRAKPA